MKKNRIIKVDDSFKNRIYLRTLFQLSKMFDVSWKFFNQYIVIRGEDDEVDEVIEILSEEIGCHGDVDPVWFAAWQKRLVEGLKLCFE